MAVTTEDGLGSLEAGNLNSNSTHVASAISYIAPTIDHNHPIYLQPSDTPFSSLITLQLTDSENYAI